MAYCKIQGCDRPAETDLCATHNRESRNVKKVKKFTPIKRAQKPIPKRSKGFIKQARIYLQLRNIWIVGKKCEVCHGDATEVHHSRGRGKMLLIVEWWVAVCRNCHRRIEENPEWAYENGYSFLRLKTTKE